MAYDQAQKSRQGVELRGYQLKAFDELREAYQTGATGAILCIATGGGKTATVAALGASAARHGSTIAFVAHRSEILDQARDAFDAAGVPAEAYRVGSVVALLNAARAGAPAPTLLVIDEGHRAAATTYRELIKLWAASWRIVLTATPKRTDKRSLGHAADVLVMGPSVKELIAGGWLVPPVYYADEAAADDKAVVGDVVQTYLRLARVRVGVVFASGLEHSRAIAAGLRAAGLRAAHIDGKTPKPERKALVLAHKTGGLDVLTCYDLLVEGWDNPAVSAVSWARATDSEIVWRQGNGRGLRPFGGKVDCVVIDHGGNVARHGFVEDELEDLQAALARGGGKRARTARVLTTCLECYAVLPSNPRPFCCARCGAELPRLRRGGPELRLGELQALNGKRPSKAKDEIDWKLWRQIDAEREARGHGKGWVWVQYGLRKAAADWSKQ